MTTLTNIQHLLDRELREMNLLIGQYLHTPTQMMNEVVTHYLQTKGKQIRPLLVLLSARMFGGINSHTLHAAAALEMLHNASLIHDDIVDETMTRRGTPTINSMWGNHVAVLSGDFFVSNALAAGIHTGKIEIIAGLSALGKELSLGEIDQMTNARDHCFREENYLAMITRKTASLFRHCVSMGALSADAPVEEAKGLVKFAELLGICFQIKDDIFDYFPNPQIGKPTGNDLREGKVTLPLLYALSNAPQDEAMTMKELLERGELSETEILELLEFAKRNGGIDYAFRRMRDFQNEAEEFIAPYPHSDSKQAFRDLFEFIIARDK